MIMQGSPKWRSYAMLSFLALLLNGCATTNTTTQQTNPNNGYPYSDSFDESKYVSRLPTKVSMGNEKVILVDPKIFAWGAYDKNGDLIRGGMATAGGEWCDDIQAPCRTSTGSFRISRMRGEECVSSIYPIPTGGWKMPYCTFFHNGQSIHGSPDRMMVESNFSHGCVHVRIPDAEWIQTSFAQMGTKVVVLPY